MRRDRWTILAICSLLFLTAGCEGSSQAAVGSASTPSPCTTSDVRVVVGRFIDAFNRGDSPQLDQLVSDQLFSWYSTDAPGQRFGAEAKDRGTLVAYFAARHQQHERLVLNSLDVTFTNSRAGGFVFSLTRSADDGLAPLRYDGKGEVQCAIRPISVAVWAMGRRQWSPIDLLPQAAAVIILVAVIVALLLWRRQSAQRHMHVGA